MKKKICCLFIMILCLLPVLSGCGNTANPENSQNTNSTNGSQNQNETNPGNGNQDKGNSTDETQNESSSGDGRSSDSQNGSSTSLIQGNGNANSSLAPYNQCNYCSPTHPMMPVNDGFYYNDYFSGHWSMRYYDQPSETDISLCNKPECSHDGNQFCTATNSSYQVFKSALYDNAIYSFATSSDNNTLRLLLLSHALDGTSLEEVVCLYEITSDVGSYVIGVNLLIHEGKVFVSYHIVTDSKPTVYYSSIASDNPGLVFCTVYDLATGKTKNICEYDAKELTWSPNSFNACGDYFYYLIKMKNQMTLQRYQISTGEVKEVNLPVSFQRYYTLIDENTLAYYHRGRGIATYDFTTGTSTDPKIHLINQYGSYDPGILLYYEGYIIISHRLPVILETKKEGDPDENPLTFRIFDLDGREVANFTCKDSAARNLYILDGIVYLADNVEVETCSFKDILSGNAVWTLAYKRNTPGINLIYSY